MRRPPRRFAALALVVVAALVGPVVLAALLPVLVPGGGRAGAAVQPDPGNAAAWASGLATLADPPGALALFDQPARLFPAGNARHAAGVARVRPFGFEPLARARLAAVRARGDFAAGLGVETFGPAGARRTRLGAALAWRRVTPGRTLALGAAWHEARRDVARPGAPVRSGALDAGAVLERRRLALSIALRSLASGGAPAARADPDWTAEARLDTAPARLHAAIHHDLGGTRLGAGAAFVAGPLVVRTGACGAPWTWGLGLSIGRGGGFVGAARSHHPRLGASDAVDGGIAW